MPRIIHGTFHAIIGMWHGMCGSIMYVGRLCPRGEARLINKQEGSLQMHRLGKRLLELRRRHGFSQERLAANAGVSVRAIQYWEAGRQMPRDVELDQVLTALNATPSERALAYAALPDQRGIRLMRRMEAESVAVAALLGPLPGIGDLIKALRVRSGKTQQQLADGMRVNRSTVIRWEATRTVASGDDMVRLFSLLDASPEEQAALSTRRLAPSFWPPELTPEECFEQFSHLQRIRSGDGTLLPLADLSTLALKRQIRSLLNRSPEMLKLLAQVEVYHSWWLHMHGRVAEACAGNRRALSFVRGRFTPETFWVSALNMLAAHAAKTARGPEHAVRLLHRWLPVLPASIHTFLLFDMALYAGRAQLHEEAEGFLSLARNAMTARTEAGAQNDWYYDWYDRMTTARVLLSGGRAVEALNCLPANENLVGDGHVASLLIWAETLLAAGEKTEAAHALRETETLLAVVPLPERWTKLEQLKQLL